ncbi:hypothetical protein [Solemya elarraichensis gill symbiont]|uniref:hypothetical protein n=1 Tax=Solemya elarraichensis gill symbiont TaxID=1918949 RepID=UPI001428A7F7|nr:hypothetical protein [Solemya elarraichensis gill symbiont]
MMKKLLTLASILGSGAAMAHPGHALGEAMHGFWYAEHILLLLAIAAVAGLVAWNKR